MVCYEWVGDFVLFIISYILNLIDLFFTMYWIDNFGIGAEANPIGTVMFENELAEIIKIIVIGGLLLFLSIMDSVYSNKTAHYGLIIICVIYSIVCVIHCVLWLYIKSL